MKYKPITIFKTSKNKNKKLTKQSNLRSGNTSMKKLGINVYPHRAPWKVSNSPIQHGNQVNILVGNVILPPDTSSSTPAGSPVAFASLFICSSSTTSQVSILVSHNLRYLQISQASRLKTTTTEVAANTLECLPKRSTVLSFMVMILFDSHNPMR